MGRLQGAVVKVKRLQPRADPQTGELREVASVNIEGISLLCRVDADGDGCGVPRQGQEIRCRFTVQWPRKAFEDGGRVVHWLGDWEVVPL